MNNGICERIITWEYRTHGQKNPNKQLGIILSKQLNKFELHRFVGMPAISKFDTIMNIYTLISCYKYNENELSLLFIDSVIYDLLFVYYDYRIYLFRMKLHINIYV